MLRSTTEYAEEEKERENKRRVAEEKKQKKENEIKINQDKRIAADKKRQEDIQIEREKQEKATADAIVLQKSIVIDSKMLLVQVGQFDVKAREIKKLLNRNADINYQAEDDGYTALMIAIDAQNDRIAEYLLNQGANPLIKNKNNEIASDLVSRGSPLFVIIKGYELLYTIFNVELTTIKSLLKAGADINFQGLGGYSPLLIAVEQSLVELVEFLLLNGADLTLTRKDGLGVFDLVSDESILELLNRENTIDELSSDTHMIYQHDHGFFDSFSPNQSVIGSSGKR